MVSAATRACRSLPTACLGACCVKVQTNRARPQRNLAMRELAGRSALRPGCHKCWPPHGRRHTLLRLSQAGRQPVERSLRFGELALLEVSRPGQPTTTVGEGLRDSSDQAEHAPLVEAHVAPFLRRYVTRGQRLEHRRCTATLHRRCSSPYVAWQSSDFLPPRPGDESRETKSFLPPRPGDEHRNRAAPGLSPRTERALYTMRPEPTCEAQALVQAQVWWRLLPREPVN